jgi:hypothetical protein
MTLKELRLPVIFVTPRFVWVARDLKELAVFPVSMLKQGWLQKAMFIEIDGRAVRARSVIKAPGTGFLDSVLLKTRVEFMLDEPFQAGVDDVKNAVLECLGNWDVIKIRGDFEALKAKLDKTQSVAEVIRFLEEN